MGPLDRLMGRQAHDQAGMYTRFGVSLGVAWVVMFLLAFSQIDRFSHFELSLSVFWISSSMVAAMGLIMLTTMGNMFSDKKIKTILYVVFGVLLVGAFIAGRLESFVGDDAFLRSMIPHHSRAIHMCQEATLQDPEIQELCRSIIETQREEIVQMNDIMDRRG